MSGRVRCEPSAASDSRDVGAQRSLQVRWLECLPADELLRRRRWWHRMCVASRSTGSCCPAFSLHQNAQAALAGAAGQLVSHGAAVHRKSRG